MKSIKTPWTTLNKILKGWRDGEVTVWSGNNGAGKSTILSQVFIDAAQKGIKSCIYSGEMPPYRYLRWAMIQCARNNKLTLDQIVGHLMWMDGKIWILNITDTIEVDKLLSDFEYAARRYNVRHFIVDSLMKISFKSSEEYEQQKKFMNRLCGFAQTFDVHVHLVAHPRKGGKDSDVPGKVDIKGTGHITDLAHNVIVLARADEEIKEKAIKKGKIPSDMRLYIKKNREFGNEGAINMMFSEQTKRFTEKEE